MPEEKKKHEGFQRQSQNNVILKRTHLMLRRVQAMCDCDSDAVGGWVTGIGPCSERAMHVCGGTRRCLACNGSLLNTVTSAYRLYCTNERMNV